MKKTKKALASLAIAGMALTIVPFNAFADSAVPTRLAGTTAAQTANAIADQTGYTGTAILASSTSYGMVDALTAGPLAAYLKAPILLTGAGNTLDADTKAELTKLNVKTVYVTSGTAVISQAVLDQLTGMGVTVVPLGGVDRAETSVNIAKKMTGVTKVAVANGIPDALSIASIASAANEPILLTDKNSVPASVAAYLAANSGITATDVIGGTGIISDAVKAQFPGATRHAGTSAYDTNNQVIQDFSSAINFTNVYVANGETRIDALAGAPLAAQTKSAIVLTNGTVPAAAAFVHSKLADGAVVTALGGAAVVSETVRNGVITGQVATPNGPLSVTSVSAAAADSFKVVFNHAPADTSKVTFTVQNLSTPVTVTATWNADKSAATLQNSANFPEGTYTVDVKDDTTDLGTSSVTIDQQKIASINVTSTKLGVVSTTTSGGITTQTGYATYNVLDQYGNDITTGALANSLTFQSGVGTVDAKDGLLTLTPNVQNLMQFATVVITGYDSTSGVSTSATLTTSTQIGTLSDFQFGTLTNADGKSLTAGDTSVFYASFTAKDISGNPTTSYDLIKGGLILHSDNNGNNNLLTTSNSYVTATVEEDPSDSSKAVIKVVATGNSDALTMDMPTVITAMTWTGTTSSLNTTLKKSSQIDTFTLMAPAQSIAVDEGKEIPFRALDQNGQALTKYSDLNTKNLTISNAKLVENTDGTASLLAGTTGDGFTNDGQQVITATTSTGKYSSITINIQKYAKADTLSLDQSILLSNMQSGAAQSVDFGYNWGGFTVKDQYGRVLDMVGKSTGGKGTATDPNYNYKVFATTSGSISVVGTDSAKNNTTTGTAIAYGANGIKITANTGLGTNGGTGTVTFKLVNLNELDSKGNAKVADTSNPTAAELASLTVIDSKSVNLQIVKDTDIKDYTMDTVSDPIYANADTSTTAGAITGRMDGFSANPYVYGKTSSGSKVILAGTPIIGESVDSSDFVIDGTVPSTGIDYMSAGAVAKELANNVTSSSTTFTVTLRGADGYVHAVKTPIKSSTDTPVAKQLQVVVNTWTPGITLNDAGDAATVNASDIAPGKIMARFDKNGANPGRAGVYFRAIDQYGTKASQLAQIIKVSGTHQVTANGVTTDVDGNGFVINQDGTIDSSSVVNSGDKITLSAITTNGLVKTIKLTVN